MYVLFICAAVLVVLSLVLMIVPGFQFSITLCLAFAALLVLVYYLLKVPTPLTMAIFRILCVCIAIGIVAAVITGSFIWKAAFTKMAPSCEYVVVLGAGVRGTTPSLALSERITAAYNYLTTHPDATAVLSGGQGPGEDMTEAACMFRELTNRGIDPERLLLEERSTSTMENLQFSLELLEAETGTRPRKIGIISSEYHLYRATRFAGLLDLEAAGIPAKTTWFPIFLNYFLREIVAVWKFLLLGP